MILSEPLVLQHSWPLWDQSLHFDLGCILNCAVTDALEPAEMGALGVHHAGLWECDLTDNSLIWSGGVYDIFGFPRGIQVTREDALSCYSEHSRALMEQLRAYALRHRRGFTVDVDIQPATGERRRTRLIAAPVCEDDQVVRLHGLKLLI
jgi:PAS domain-containing protein